MFHGPSSVRAAQLSRPHQQDVAGTDADTGGGFRCFQIFPQYALAGVEPRHTAQPGDVQQYAPGQNAAL